MKIDVTQADIDAGAMRSSTGCPIALAIRRAYPQLATVSISPDSLASWRCTYAVQGQQWPSTVMLPGEAGAAARRFDHTHVMHPFAFDLNLLEEGRPCGETE